MPKISGTHHSSLIFVSSIYSRRGHALYRRNSHVKDYKAPCFMMVETVVSCVADLITIVGRDGNQILNRTMDCSDCT